MKTRAHATGARSSVPPGAAPVVHYPVPRPYLSASQLSELTPWTVSAIEKMIQRGTLIRDVHFFQRAPRSERIFCWHAIEAFIRGLPHARPLDRDPGPVAHCHGASDEIDVTQAETDLRRLLS